MPPSKADLQTNGQDKNGPCYQYLLKSNSIAGTYPTPSALT